jgi:hypothetical protein
MSIDDLAREATTELRRAATATLEPDDMLRQMHRARARRTGVLAATALVLALVAGVGVTSTLVVADRAGPADRSATAVGLPRSLCRQPDVTCLGGRRLRVDIAVPVTATLPRTFQPGVAVVPHGAEFYRADVWTTGVTVMDDARAMRYEGTWRRDSSAGTTARSMARRLASRPFLKDTTTTRRTLGSRTAWLVRGTLRPGAALPATKAGAQVAPTFANGEFTAGVGPRLRGTYMLVDQPDGGVTVIWSWHFGQSRPQLGGNRELIDSLRLG